MKILKLYCPGSVRNTARAHDVDMINVPSIVVPQLFLDAEEMSVANDVPHPSPPNYSPVVMVKLFPLHELRFGKETTLELPAVKSHFTVATSVSE